MEINLIWINGGFLVLNIGFEHSFTHGVADFLASVDSDNKAQPDFRNALQTQKVCEAVIDSGKSLNNGNMTNVELYIFKEDLDVMGFKYSYNTIVYSGEDYMRLK